MIFLVVKETFMYAFSKATQLVVRSCAIIDPGELSLNAFIMDHSSTVPYERFADIL